MNNDPSICLIGDVFIDVTLKNAEAATKLRLGGIIHSARALWALNIAYDVGFFGPSYLDDQVIAYLKHHGANNIYKLGDVIGTPNVMLIEESKEVGDQGYEFLLRDEFSIKNNLANIDTITKNNYSDILLISGNYDFIDLVNRFKAKIHVDVANNVKNVNEFKALKRKIDTLFISTSSDIFKIYFLENFKDFIFLFNSFSNEVVLKENRGGSRSYNFIDQKIYLAHSQPRKISHSVGVGDVFDATYISGTFIEQSEKNVLASWIAAEYAVTSFPDDFKRSVSRVLKSSITDLKNMSGVSLPWENRKKINIYIAAPDFSFVDIKHIDILDAALRYHNFTPRRPIKENGEMEKDASKHRKQELYAKDMQLFQECSIVVGVLLYNDPGTLIEIGYAKGKGIPTIVYDPYKIATNCMLTELPEFLSSDLDEVITEVFIKSTNII